MLSNHIINSFRNIFRNKSFSLIKITGLSIGLTVFFLLVLYVQYEKSFDRFFPDAENIYRVQLEQFQNGKSQFNKATSTYIIGPLLKEKIPSVTEYARGGFERCLVYRNEIKYNDQELLWVDSTFLKVIQVKMLQGDISEALTSPYSLVLSDALAKVYFGDEDPMGQVVYINEHLPFIVRGIYKALPSNTHFNFKLLLSLSTGNVLWPQLGWGSKSRGWGGHSWIFTYLKLAPGTDIKKLEKEIETVVDAQLPDRLKTEKIKQKYTLKNIRDIHLNSNLEIELKPNGSAKNTRMLFLIGILIIVIAWINFINLGISEAFDRAKETGIRKINGAFRGNIISQFMIEVFILNLISFAATLLLVFISLPVFEYLSGQPVGEYLRQNLSLLWVLLIMIVAGTLFAGIYPAFVLSSFQTKNVLKGSLFKGKERFSFKKILVIFQLSAAIILIISVITIFKQLFFINSTDPGFKKDFVVVINAPSTLNMDSTKMTKYRVFKNLIKANSQVKDVTSSTFSIGKECLTELNINKIDGKESSYITLKLNQIDESYLNVYSLNLASGENFEFQKRPRNDIAMINQSAVKVLGFKNAEDAVGRFITDTRNIPIKIIGVISDFHQESFRRAIRPMIFFYQHPNNFGQYSVLFKSSNFKEALAFAEDEWILTYPRAPFDFDFLDQQLKRLYLSEERFGYLLLTFASLSIFIACLGLLGLIMILTQKNVKQIGIRKVNGAGVDQIMLMLNRDFLQWVGVAFVIATPVATYLMNSWLKGFAYKTDLSWWIFALAGVLTLFISLLTVSLQSWSAASRNPVEALKYE
jgi:putative ABC transport system permease protein